MMLARSSHYVVGAEVSSFRAWLCQTLRIPFRVDRRTAYNFLGNPPCGSEPPCTGLMCSAGITPSHPCVPLILRDSCDMQSLPEPHYFRAQRYGRHPHACPAKIFRCGFFTRFER